MIFNGTTVIEFDITVKKSQNKKERTKQALIPLRDYPVTTFKPSIIMQDSLFLNPSKVYINFLLSLRETKGKQQFFHGLNTIIYFLHVKEIALAYNVFRLLTLNDKKQVSPSWKVAILLKQVQRIRAIMLEQESKGLL